MSRHGFRPTSFCFSLLLAAGIWAAPGYAISKDFNQTVPLQPCGTFELQNVNGPVDVQGWDRNEVEIHAVKTAKNQETDLERVAIEVDARPDSVAVPSDLQADIEAKCMNANFSSELPITMESTDRLREMRGKLGRGGPPIRLRTVNGGIRLTILRSSV